MDLRKIYGVLNEKMNIEKFNLIKEKWSKTSSWAVWARAGEKPKSNIGDLSIFDVDKNKGLFDILNPNVIMVGLNAADRPITREWGNFHDLSPKGQDYKIRYAFDRTKYWGAYMTDLIKGHFQTDSNILKSILKNNQEILENNIFRFYEELNDIANEEFTLKSEFFIFHLHYKGKGNGKLASIDKVNKIISTSSANKKKIVLFFGDPYIVDEINADVKIVAYSDSTASLASAVMLLTDRKL